MAGKWKWVPGVAGGGLTTMTQVGPSDAKINFCKWMPLPSDSCLSIPELDKIVWIVAAGLAFWSIGLWIRDNERFKPMFWPAILIAASAAGLIAGIIMAIDHWPAASGAASRLPPIKVEILDRSNDQAAAKASEQMAIELRVVHKIRGEPSYKYDSRIHILNVSRDSRVSLKLAAYIVDFQDGRMGFASQSVQSTGLKLSLAPQEETEGSFSISLPKVFASDGEHSLIILDRLSNRKAKVRVPGRFPRATT
jgi:hypothetical protein